MAKPSLLRRYGFATAAAGVNLTMKYIATIVFAIAFGIIIGGAGATYLFIVMEEPSDAAAHSCRTFQAADLDAYRINMEELEAIETCKEQLLGESSN